MGPLALSPASISLYLVAAAWLGNALYALGAPDSALRTWSPTLIATSMIAFVMLHGRRTEGVRGLLLFAGLVFLLGWTAESLSIVTGIPFGHYQYTDIMAPFLGHVPVLVLVVYAVMGYLCWSMARLLLLRRDDVRSPAARYGVPILAAALMVLWDLSMDPLRASIEQRWVWRDGGSHFGVPIQNFVGWFLTTWTMFQAYALMRPPPPVDRRIESSRDTTLFRLSVPLMYLAFAVEYVLNPAVIEAEHAALVVDSSKHTIEHIQGSIAVLTLCTMLPMAALTIYRILHGHAGRTLLALKEAETQ